MENAPSPIPSEAPSSDGWDSAMYRNEMTAGRSLTAQAPSVFGRNSDIWFASAEEHLRKHPRYAHRYTRTCPADVHHNQYFKFADGTPEKRVTQVLIWCVCRLVDSWDTDRRKGDLVPTAKEMIAIQVLKLLERRLFDGGIKLNPQDLPTFPPPNLRCPGPNKQDEFNQQQLASLNRFQEKWRNVAWTPSTPRKLQPDVSDTVNERRVRKQAISQRLKSIEPIINEAEESSIYYERIIALIQELNAPLQNQRWLN